LAAGTALLTSALADASSYITNEIVRRPRPSDHGLHILHVIKNYYSFPSGHVVHAVAFFGFVLFLTWRMRRPALPLWPVRAVLIALIVLMGPSRVLEGEHWPSDAGVSRSGGFRRETHAAPVRPAPSPTPSPHPTACRRG
jgi:undecaprenyl-diphosphatase